MSALTSLLVRDQTVSVRKIEEAIQRQVISGGELESVLLGMGAIEENVMNAYRAALYGLLPATRDEVMSVLQDTVRVVPRDVAAKYRLIPLSVEDRTLVVAVTAPLSIEDEEQLGFLLSFDVVYRIVCEVRLAAALSLHYGIDALPRMRRLAEKLLKRDAGRVPYVAPPEELEVDDAAEELPTKNAAVIDWDDDDDGPEVAPAETPAESQAESETPAPEVDARVTDPDIEPFDSDRRTERPPAAVLAQIEGPIGAAAASATASPVASPASSRAQAAVRPSRPPQGRRSDLARKLRGPLTAKAAVELLKEAEGRDEILEIFFVFARQFFDYTALFVIHDDVAEGREAHGEGTTTEELLQIAVPLDVPGLFATAREGLVPVVGTLSHTELDLIVARDLSRPATSPSIVAPVAIRKRLVLMLYGDRDGEAFELSDLPELMGLLPRVADAFLALLVRIKRRGYAPADPQEETGLKSAATRVAAGAAASLTNEDRSGYHPPSASPESNSDQVEGPAAVALHQLSEPPSEPEPEPEPSLAASPDSDAGLGTDLLDKLGVPRSAPPPPGVDGPADFRLEKKATRPDGHAAIAQQRSLGHPGDPDFPPRTIDTDDPGEVEPHERPGGEQDLPSFAKSQVDRPQTGNYQLSGGVTEVLGRGQAPREEKKRETPQEATQEAEPRRAGGGARRRAAAASDTSVDVVDVPDVTIEEPADEDEDHRHTLPQPAPNMPSVIVDMGGTVEDLVDDLEKCGPDGEEAAVLALLSMGESALPTMTQRFPGPLWFDRDRPHRRLPHGRDVSSIARCLVAFREKAIPYVISLTEAERDETRFYGTLLASEFVSRDLLRPVGLRIFDTDPKTQLLAVDVMRRFSVFTKEMEEFAKGLRVEARVDRKDVDRRRIAIRALGLLRDVRSADLLVELLSAKEPSLAKEAHESLLVLTRQDFGDSQRRWKQWAERNRDCHRVEWLIDALGHSDEDIRAASVEELQVLTQEYYGYHPSQPKHDREVAQKRYRKWWKSDGQARFAAP